MLTNLMEKKRWSRPTEGKHTIIIKEVTIEERPDFEMLILNTVLDDKREYTIRMFCRNDECRDLDFLSRALIEKYGEGHTTGELLQRAIQKEEKLDVWIYYNTVINNSGETQEFTNHYWFERTIASEKSNAVVSATTIAQSANDNLPI